MPGSDAALSSRGLGRCPLTAVTRVRIPLGLPSKDLAEREVFRTGRAVLSSTWSAFSGGRVVWVDADRVVSGRFVRGLASTEGPVEIGCEIASQPFVHAPLDGTETGRRGTLVRVDAARRVRIACSKTLSLRTCCGDSRRSSVRRPNVDRRPLRTRKASSRTLVDVQPHAATRRIFRSSQIVRGTSSKSTLRADFVVRGRRHGNDVRPRARSYRRPRCRFGRPARARERSRCMTR